MFELNGRTVKTKDISLTFNKDGTASCSDGTAGTYSIKGDRLEVKLERHDGANVLIGFDSKFTLERNFLTIEQYSFPPKPVTFHRSNRVRLEAFTFPLPSSRAFPLRGRGDRPVLERACVPMQEHQQPGK